MYCSKLPIGALSVWYRTQIYWSVFKDTNDGCVGSATRNEAKLAYENFLMASIAASSMVVHMKNTFLISLTG